MNLVFLLSLALGASDPLAPGDHRSAVDRYLSALLMPKWPKWLIQEAGQRYDLLKWRDLYRLADEAHVNITNLTVRLQRLGLISLREGDKRIYRSDDEFTGQKSLF